jgi:hypothetical protein
MFTKITYIGTLNGVHGIWCGFKPEGVVVEEERTILYPEHGFILKKDDKTFSAVWLKDGDVKENYTEVKKEKDL